MTAPAALIGALFLKPALVLAAAATIAVLLHRQSAAARHAVWAGAVAAALILPVLGAILPGIPVPWVAPVEQSEPRVAPLESDGPAIAVTGAHPTTARNDPPTAGRDPLATGLLALWTLGVLLLACRRIGAGVRIRALLRRAAPVHDSRLASLFARAAPRSRIQRQVQLRLSGEIATPALAGVFRPVILLPAAAEGWTEADLLAVFVHELGHLARRDGLLNLMADCAAMVYWCNPAVHYAVRRMRSESERACDDQVLRFGAGVEEYAHLLLRVAANGNTIGVPPRPVIAMARPRELETRLLAVLDQTVSHAPLPHARGALLASLAVMLALPTAALTPTHRASSAAQVLPEPDQRGDSLALPDSERLPPVPMGSPARSAATALLAGRDSALARDLIAALDHQPTHTVDLVRERAAWALARADGLHLIEPLLGALHSPDWRVRAYAAWALAGVRDPRVTTSLAELLEHPVWRVRAMAAAALRQSRDPRVADAMTAVLTDPAWQVRVEAVEYLGALGGPALSERLEPRLEDRHVAVRHAAERALSLAR